MYPVNPVSYPQDGGSSLYNAHVHGITNQAHYARNLAQQQQAEEAERGQHQRKQLSIAAAFLDIRASQPDTSARHQAFCHVKGTIVRVCAYTLVETVCWTSST